VTLRRRVLALDLMILVVAGHSLALGLCLLSFPQWTLRAVGWEYAGEVFWPSQAGLFLIILGVAYATAVRWRPLVWLLIGSKACAIVFLSAHAFWLDAPRLAGYLGLADGAMGLTTALLWLSVRRGPRGEARHGAAESDS